MEKKITLFHGSEKVIEYQTYLEMMDDETDGIYMQDIMRGGIRNDDPRIPRNLSE